MQSCIYMYHFTQGLQSQCLPCATTKLARSPLKAQRMPKGCLGLSMVVHRMFRHRHGRHGRLEILSTLKPSHKDRQRSVAHRSLKGGRRKVHALPWSHNGCSVVGHWSRDYKPYKRRLLPLIGRPVTCVLL